MKYRIAPLAARVAMASKRAQLADWSSIATQPARRHTAVSTKRSVENERPNCMIKFYSNSLHLEMIVTFASGRYR